MARHVGISKHGSKFSNLHKYHAQVLIEERISQTEKRVLAEAQKQFDLELAELRERIDAVHKVPV